MSENANEKKFLDMNGVSHLWGKMKTLVSNQSAVSSQLAAAVARAAAIEVTIVTTSPAQKDNNLDYASAVTSYGVPGNIVLYSPGGLSANMTGVQAFAQWATEDGPNAVPLGNSCLAFENGPVLVRDTDEKISLFGHYFIYAKGSTYGTLTAVTIE